MLEALAAHGTMSGGDLLALGIKGYNKNTAARVMAGPVADGLVACTSRGPAKFYALA